MAPRASSVSLDPVLAEALRGVDPDGVDSPVRVYVLAKQLGVKSKAITVALEELGLKKVAQSSMSAEEIAQLIGLAQGERPAHAEKNEAADAAAEEPSAEEAPAEEPTAEQPAKKTQKKAAKKTSKKAAKKSAKKSSRKPSSAKRGSDAAADVATDGEPSAEERPDTEDKKLRERVRKNVANEINQLEKKVEAEISEQIAERDAAADEIDDVTSTDDVTDAVASASVDTELGDTVAAADADQDDASQAGDQDGDTDEAEEGVEDATAALAPQFQSPRRRGRRRARRSTEKDPVEKDTADKAAAAPSPENPSGDIIDDADATALDADVVIEEPLADDLSEPAEDVTEITEPVALKGSTRIEAQRRRRSELREAGRKRAPIVSQAEFLARRESVTRTMVVRERPRHDGAGSITQVGVLEDSMLVEHFVTTEKQASMIGNIYLGRVQNVLASMEAAFIDIGTGRNGVLYAPDIDWRAFGAQGKSRRVEQVLRSGDQVLVQVSKDPLGHKGPRLTTQISLAGRYLVYVPNGRSAGISRKLPAPERKRLKAILERVIPGQGGAIIRTAAEHVEEPAIAADVNRLHSMWEDISARAEREKSSKGAKPVTLYEEPNMLVKVVRDLFNEDFTSLVVDGRRPWNTVRSYVESVAPDLADRLEEFDRAAHGDVDAFVHYRIDEQIQKALSRKVWLPSGGHLVVDRTEAMVVIDVNTGKFTGSGGNLEETVTRNNLEAAEEIVRQMRLRDLGGMIVVDFIDMVLPENRDLVLRRLKEALGRDRTRHQVSEVTSLGLVQMTRKRLGTGLLETFATECEHCDGRGLILHEDPVDERLGDTPREKRHSVERTKSPAPAPQKPAAEPVEQPARRDVDEEKELADMVAGVLVDDEAPRKPGRRRGRRGGSRGRGSAGREAESTNEKASEASREETAEVDSTSYEEAVAAFEASPRRKRRTRGNSRSDHRPRPEDYADSKARQPHDSEDTRSAADDGDDILGGVEVRRVSGRGRRRAVRRRASAQPQRTQPAVSTAPAAEPTEDVPTVRKAQGRGRRRAVRRRAGA
ncbi:Rne/Rng family ribonuclease [Corynebacterium uterequi]|uniref:Ribonuclease E n=1 Tax=Corynebacterium uterequi TaxID=1072256 RepID=A0A0G3HKK3_9CORY|nr:Rne/Rng family ribonuclease [Corynebacterium uterequi]AKK11632.1 ribonuclease, Rne/Rng family [Corynebacterium uterequi]